MDELSATPVETAPVAAAVSSRNVAGRALSAVGLTVSRQAIALVVGILVARAMGPVQFGNYMFLLAGFVTLHLLLDLSSSQAFFTQICQKSWARPFYLGYGAWIGLQFLLPGAAILLFPGQWVSEIWRGNGRELVLLAFAASYAQRVFWQAVMQVYESIRLTARIQSVMTLLMAFQLGFVILLKAYGLLSIPTLLCCIAGEFSIGGLVMLMLLRRRPAAATIHSASEGVHSLLLFMAPLVPSLLLISANSFGETWLLQIFGGPQQQAFFNVAQQYANIGLVFGFSSANVFWKEIAAAHARGDHEGLRKVYSAGTRILFLVPALIAGFGVFWSREIIQLLLGNAYAPAAPVFAVTLTAAIAQCAGSVMTVTFMATGRTRSYAIFTAAFVSLGMLGSVLFLWLLKLGALGLAIKLAALNIGFTLLYDAYICRQYGWKTDNLFRISVVGLLAATGWLGHVLVVSFGAGAPPAIQIALGAVAFAVLTTPFLLLAAGRLGYFALLRQMLVRRG